MNQVEIRELKKICSSNLDIEFRIVDAGRTDLVGALNFGLQNCTYDLIARMDQDDLMTEGRLALQQSFMDQNPDHVLVGGKVLVIDALGNPKHIQSYPTTFQAISKEIRNGNCFAHPAVMFRKSSLLKVGLYSNYFEYAEDYDLFVRLMKIGKCANLNELVLNYRISDLQVSHIHRDAQVTSTQAIILNLALEDLKITDKFPLPLDNSKLKEWNRKIMNEAIPSLFLPREVRRIKKGLRQAIARSFFAIARSTNPSGLEAKETILRTILMAFFYSPGITTKSGLRVISRKLKLV